MAKRVRRLRHWKQHYCPNAEFIWRKVLTWDGELTVIGEKIPRTLKDNLAKMKRFWEAQVIELAEFNDPDVVTGQTSWKRFPENLVSKIADRRWSVDGIDKSYSIKRVAIEAARQHLLTT